MLNFIVNVRSGKGRGLKTLHKIIERCAASNTAYTVHITESKGHAKIIAKTLCEHDAHTIVAVGGDGTFHEVINGVAGFKNVRVGFISAGRGNDFARAAKINKKPIRALNDILRGETRRLDILSIGELRCLNIAGTGIDVEVLKRVEGKSNKITYLISLIQTIRNFVPYKMTLYTEDEGEQTYECLVTGVCNGTHLGGGMNFCPPAILDDGLMHVVVVQMPEDGKIMKAMSGFLKGKHMNKSYVHHFKTKSIKIETEGNKAIQLDGEIYENISFDCKILQGELTTFTTTK